MNVRAFNKLLQPVYRRIRLLLRRGVLTSSDSSPKLQAIQVQITPELILEMEQFEAYGFASNPQNGAEPIVGNIEGKSHPISLLVADRRFKIRNLQKGEVAIYTDEGDVVHFKRNQLIEINSGAHVKVVAPQCTIDAANTHITGAVQIDGAVTCSATITAAGQIDSAVGVSTNGIQLGTHVHGGVATGTGNTGGPQ